MLNYRDAPLQNQPGFTKGLFNKTEKSVIHDLNKVPSKIEDESFKGPHNVRYSDTMLERRPVEYNASVHLINVSSTE
jgi:hypothetical protein